MPSQPTPDKLSPELLEALRGIKTVRQFPRGAMLFQKDSPVTGVYLVESGEVRILLPTGNRQNQLLDVAGPGDDTRAQREPRRRKLSCDGGSRRSNDGSLHSAPGLS